MPRPATKHVQAALKTASSSVKTNATNNAGVVLPLVVVGAIIASYPYGQPGPEYQGPEACVDKRRHARRQHGEGIVRLLDAVAPTQAQ